MTVNGLYKLFFKPPPKISSNFTDVQPTQQILFHKVGKKVKKTHTHILCASLLVMKSQYSPVGGTTVTGPLEEADSPLLFLKLILLC